MSFEVKISGSRPEVIGASPVYPIKMSGKYPLKVRRRSGRVNIEGTYIDIENYIGHRIEWNDWRDYRDGMRGYNDKTRIHSTPACFADYWEVNRWNKKNKRHEAVRKAMKSGRTSCVI